MLKKINQFFVFFTLILFCSTYAYAGNLLPAESIKLIYTASYNGLPIKVTRTITKLGENQYQLSSTSINFLGSIEETGTFKLDSTQHIENHEYLYKRSLLGTNKTERLVYDYQNCVAVYTSKDKHRRVALDKPFHNQISYQLQLQDDVRKGLGETSYDVIVRGRPKIYKFKIVGEESIETSLGNIHTIKVARIREGSERETLLWFAPNLEYSLVKLWQREDDEDFQITLEDGMLDGISLVKLINDNKKGDVNASH